MNNINKKLLDSSFLYLQPWFYNNKLALRCELGIGEDDYMENAFSRSIQIANVLFANKKIDVAFFHQYFDISQLLLELYLHLHIILSICL